MPSFTRRLISVPVRCHCASAGVLLAPEEMLQNEESSCPSSSDNDNDENDSTDTKLTRAKRKRLRKRKLKEATKSQCRKIIGPLLRGSDHEIDQIHGGVKHVNDGAECVRQNAATNVSEEPASSSSRKGQAKAEKEVKEI